MGTRGAIGFRLDGQDKLTYNHWDSYPTGLGKDVMTFLAGYEGTLEKMRADADRIILVDETSEITPAIQDRCAGSLDLTVGAGDRWYQLLRGCQGKLEEYLKIGLMTDDKDFLRDSLFCEWAYIVNFDTQELEVYQGFNKNPNAEGRYADLGAIKEFAGVALLKTFPLSEVKAWSSDQIEEVTNALENIGREDDSAE